MKKVMAIMLTIIMLLSASIISSSAATVFTVSLDTSKTTVNRGETFTVNATAVDIKVSSGLVGLDVVIYYDADKLVPVKKAGIFPAQWNGMGADFSPEPEKDANGNYTGVWKTHVLFDSDETGKGVKTNKAFGIALTFNVKDDATGGAAMIKAIAGETLCGADDELNNVFGNGAELRMIVESSDKLKLRSDSSYTLDNAYLTSIGLKQSAATVISNFENEKVVVKSSAGDKLADTKYVGTGCSVVLMIDDTAADAATVIVKGDTDGTGIIDSTDYIMIKKHFLKISVLTGEYFISADVDGNGIVDSTDYIALKRHILGISLIK